MDNNKLNNSFAPIQVSGINLEALEDDYVPANPIKPPSFTEVFVLGKKDYIMFAVAVIFNIIGVALSFWGGFNIGYTISNTLSFALLTYYFCEKGVKIKAFPLICGIISLILSAVPAVTSNWSVNFWGLIVSACLSVVWFASLVGKEKTRGDLGIIRVIGSSVFMNTFKYPVQSVKSLFIGKNAKNSLFLKILCGIAIAIPVTLIVTMLLMSSDLAFQSLVEKIIDDASTLIAQIILGIVITPFFIAFAFGLKKSVPKPSKESAFKGVENVYIISFLATLSFVYVVYLFSQLSYLFDAFKSILPSDYNFTAAEYARRGFFEMSVIAFVNLVVIFATILLSKKDREISFTVKLLNTFIGFFTLVIIATAISKMVLYIDRFGMTALRITTSAFMLFLTIVTVMAIIRCFAKSVEVLKTALVIAGVILLSLGFGNVNKVVASYNYNAYINGHLSSSVVDSIYEVGDAGIPYIVKLSESDDITISNRAKRYLNNRVTENFKKVEGGWKLKDTELGSWNYTNGEAIEALKEYIRNN